MVNILKIEDDTLSIVGIGIPLTLINIIVTILVILVLLAAYRRILRRLVDVRVLDRVYYEKLYRVTELALFIIALLSITYYVTGEHAVVYVIAGMILIVAASSWQIIASLVSFYILLFSRLISRGDYIILPGGPQGRVREINLLYTTLESPNGVYAVPNLELVRRGRLLLKDTTQLRIVVRIWGFEDTSIISDLRLRIAEVLEEVGRSITVHAASPRVYIDEVSADSVTIKIDLPVSGPRPNMARASDVIMALANALKELGYSFTITMESVEGYEQRWRTVG